MVQFRKAIETILCQACSHVHLPHLANHTLAKMRLASHPDTKIETLFQLAKSKCERVLTRVAENPNTSAVLLKQLAKHPCPEVRIAVAENANSSIDLLRILARDPDPDVRYSLSENHNVPGDILITLVVDENPYVAARAIQTLERLKLKEGSFIRFPWFQIQERQTGLG